MDAFYIYHRQVLAGIQEDDVDGCLVAIRTWLESNANWLIMVEDATRECRALFEYVPLKASVGRLLITTKEDLEKELPERTHFEPLTGLSARSIIESWQKMNIYSNKITKQQIDSSTETDLETRCLATRSSVVGLSPVEYVKPSKSKEKSKARRKRRRDMLVQLLEYDELTKPELKCFIEDELHGLPLTARLCGHLIKEQKGKIYCVASCFLSRHATQKHL